MVDDITVELLATGSLKDLHLAAFQNKWHWRLGLENMRGSDKPADYVCRRARARKARQVRKYIH